MAKSPPQDALLDIQQKNKFKEEAEESSLFSFKIGLYKLGCSLLMNGLVHEASEVKFIVYTVFIISDFALSMFSAICILMFMWSGIM